MLIELFVKVEIDVRYCTNSNSQLIHTSKQWLRITMYFKDVCDESFMPCVKVFVFFHEFDIHKSGRTLDRGKYIEAKSDILLLLLLFLKP